jgi:amino acid transporter
VIVCLGLAFADALNAIVSSAIIAIYAAFQMIVIGALSARLRGWKPTGAFRLGDWGLPVNIAGIVYGIGAIADLLWPRTPDQPWYMNYSLSLSVGVMMLFGLLYMTIGRPYDRGNSPAGDAALGSSR